MKSPYSIPASLLLLATTQLSSSQVSAQDPDPKRGLIYIQPGDGHERDYNIFTGANSPLTWYYTYSPWPTLTSWASNFVPMVHGTKDAAESVDRIQAFFNGTSSLGSNTMTHVLSFNEPDGDTSSGGSDSSPEHSAQIYLETIAPLRSDPYNLKVSVPATTGSPRGIEWLQDFNASCWDQNPDVGCEFDFVATHWYGDFAGMASWLGSIHDLFPDLPVWVTEFAIPGLDDDETRAFLNQSLPYLQDLEYVERYSWFGTFRDDDANEWTGDGVSMLNGDGELSALGAQYMGGEQAGFSEGESGSGGSGGDSNSASARSTGSVLAVVLAVGVSLLGLW